jgi:hypothetical protein
MNMPCKHTKERLLGLECLIDLACNVLSRLKRHKNP